MSLRNLALMAIAAAFACAPVPAKRASLPSEREEPFVCLREAPSRGRQSRSPGSDTVTGQVTISCSPGEARSSGARFLDLSRKCVAFLETATLAEVSTALANATGESVFVEPKLANLRVSLAMADSSLGEMLDALSNSLEGAP